MTEQEIMEGNKLIAEFMGAKFKGEDAYGNGDMRYYAIYEYGNHPDMMIVSAGRKFELHDLIYERSWDWLMPVVEKIENTEWKESSFGRFCTEIESDHNKFEYRQHTVKINYHVTDEGWRSAGAGRAKTKIEATYQAVVDFIKWYNQNK